MSRERARRRAERQAAGARRAAEAQRRQRRRVDATRRRRARRAALRRLVPRLPRRGSSHRTREQRVGVAMVLVAVGAVSLLLFDTWTVRVAVCVGALLATPVVATAFFGSRSR